MHPFARSLGPGRLVLDGCPLGSALTFFVSRVGRKGDEDEKAAHPAPQRNVNVRKHTPPERNLLGHLSLRTSLCDDAAYPCPSDRERGVVVDRRTRRLSEREQLGQTYFFFSNRKGAQVFKFVFFAREAKLPPLRSNLFHFFTLFSNHTVYPYIYVLYE